MGLTRAEQAVAKRAFLAKYSYNTGQENWCLAAGDFNRDGKIDLISSSKSGDQLRVMYNDGTGEFGNARTFPALRQTRALVILDANKDGWPDVASITMIGELSILLNDKKGGFFLPKVIETDRMVQNIAAGDLNRDGAPDIILAAVSENALVIFYNDGFGFFPGVGVRVETGNKPRVIRIADLNKDNRPDMIVGCDDGYLYLHMNAAKTPFSHYSTLRSCSDNWGLAVADFNRDGRLDIASASYSERQICLHLGKQDTVFVRTQCIASGEHNFDLVADDYNLDGTIDVITCSANDQSMNFHPAGADGTLEQRIAIQSGSWNSSMVSADFDGDGDIDIATASILDKCINIHRNVSAEFQNLRKGKMWVEGTIINGDIHSPVPYQPITLVDRRGNVAGTTISNFEGHYVLNVDPKQRYTVHIRHASLPMFKTPLIVGDSSFEKNFVLSRNTGASVQGRVVDKVSGFPVGNAYMEIRDVDDSLVTKFYSDTKGYFKSFVALGLQYKVIVNHPEYKRVVKNFDITDTEAGDVVDVNLDIEPTFVAIRLRGSVVDFLFGTPLPDVNLVFQDVATGKDVLRTTTGEDGMYHLTLPVGNYRVFASKRGFYYSTANIELANKNVSMGKSTDISLPPMRSGTAMVLEEISYPKGEFTAANLPKETLNSMLRMMQDNPTLVAEIEGHTDGDGSAQTNLDLSQKRAEGIVKFLTDNGIQAKRVKARGYGESQPRADNTTEDGKRQNRRIVFKIISY